MLNGTLSVVEGGHWLRLGGSNNGQCTLKTQREQQVFIQVDTRGLAASQAYGGKLQVITNGGVVEVPVRLDLSIDWRLFGFTALVGLTTALRNPLIAQPANELLNTTGFHGRCPLRRFRR